MSQTPSNKERNKNKNDQPFSLPGRSQQPAAECNQPAATGQMPTANSQEKGAGRKSRGDNGQNMTASNAMPTILIKNATGT